MSEPTIIENKEFGSNLFCGIHIIDDAIGRKVHQASFPGVEDDLSVFAYCSFWNDMVSDEIVEGLRESVQTGIGIGEDNLRKLDLLFRFQTIEEIGIFNTIVDTDILMSFLCHFESEVSAPDDIEAIAFSAIVVSIRCC